LLAESPRQRYGSVPMARYVFITGGVVSSLGKGIAAAALGALLQARGYRVRIRKLDPYLNVDPGTMSPYQHGEVFVTDDGAETDLDLGHYERFTGRSANQQDNITTGRIYKNIIEKERRGDYLGATVQVIPHVTDEIKNFIVGGNEDYDFVICEIGGTAGDIEAMPFLEAIRQLGNDLPRNNAVYVHLTLMLQERQHVGIEQDAHLNGRSWRSGAGIGWGQRENCLSSSLPEMPRRLAGLGVRMMLLRPSRTGRTSTTPPWDKPEASRHHLGSVPWPTLVTVIVSSSFTP
jgi:hypothetical protein